MFSDFLFFFFPLMSKTPFFVYCCFSTVNGSLCDTFIFFLLRGVSVEKTILPDTAGFRQ